MKTRTYRLRRPREANAAPRTDGRHGLPRWHWYHFYFLLAAIDVGVIVASVAVHHRTLASFNNALADISSVHEDQHRLAEVRTAIIRLNAPGNNIFETGDLTSERREFDAAFRHLNQLTHNHAGTETLPPTLETHINAMTESEEFIFARFAEMQDGTLSAQEKRDKLAEAARTMPAMDRAQANAMALLADAASDLQVRQRNILDKHHRELHRRIQLEYGFVAIVAFILFGVFWYGRQLQLTHERLVHATQRVEQERRHRLASVGEMCSACAHGIRNPLASIASSAQLIREHGELDDCSRRRAADIAQSCASLNQRITRLMAFARAAPMKPERIRVGDVLDSVVGLLQARLDELALHVDRNRQADNALVTGDREGLVQAVTELLSNAMDYMPRGGRIKVYSRPADGSDRRFIRVALGVSDSGPGIAEEIKPRVWELFYTQKAGGNGIGLASVQRTVEQHGGEVFISDAVPHGADIGMVLPIAK